MMLSHADRLLQKYSINEKSNQDEADRNSQTDKLQASGMTNASEVRCMTNAKVSSNLCHAMQLPGIV
jgi:hypothetical protein